MIERKKKTKRKTNKTIVVFVGYGYRDEIDEQYKKLDFIENDL
jgi:undecaprenyl pyrophosphate synthase